MSQGNSVVANALSRGTLSLHLLIKRLLRVPRIRMRSCKTSWKIVRRFGWCGYTFPGRTSTSTQQPRPFITTPFRRQVFDTLHGLSHTGANATVKLVSQRFVWPVVGKDCCAWTRACTPCQRSKVTRHVKAPLGSFNLPSARFSHGRAAARVFWLPVLSHRHRQIHPLAWGIPSPWPPPKQSLKPSSQSGLLVSAAPSKSQPTRAGNSRPVSSRLWLPSPDPL